MPVRLPVHVFILIQGCLCYTLYAVAKQGLQSLSLNARRNMTDEETLEDWTSIASFVAIGIVFLIIMVMLLWKFARASGSCVEVRFVVSIVKFLLLDL